MAGKTASRSRGSAMIVLEDGTVFDGKKFGASGEFIGEVCFNTSMTGYQEILTDPSYAGQMVTMTYPLIGNYGVNQEDVESDRIYMGGFIVREFSRMRSNWRSTGDIDGYLKKYGVVGLAGIDTRALTMHIRSQGAMRAALSSVDLNPKSLVSRIRKSQAMEGTDLVKSVSTGKRYVWEEGLVGEPSFEVVAYDFGVKRNILRLLAGHGCRVTVVPAGTTAEEVLEIDPDGVFLSNGPGDPEPVTYAIDNVRRLLGKIPVFGIGLGHQILGLALGGGTYKLKFGHHGSNQPVSNSDTGNVEITTQNHGFAVEDRSLERCEFGEVELTHRNLNDNTLEGIRSREAGAFSVQYHPKVSSPPHDTCYLVENFASLMDEWR